MSLIIEIFHHYTYVTLINFELTDTVESEGRVKMPWQHPVIIDIDYFKTSLS